MSAYLSETAVAAMDADDPLAAYREKFHLPKDIVYLDGNSLGAAPKAAFDELETAARSEWADQLIRSWRGADWWTLGEKLGDRFAGFIGAGPGELVFCDTTSIPSGPRNAGLARMSWATTSSETARPRSSVARSITRRAINCCNAAS